MPQSGEDALNILKHDIYNLYTYNRCEVDSGFSCACRCLNKCILNYPMPTFIERKISPFKYDYDKDKVIVLFSGGKVSTATALQLKELGKDVILLHICDNPQNLFRIKDISNKLRLPFITRLNECNTKYFYGLYLLYQALEYAVNNNCYPGIYMGCFGLASIDNNDKDYWGYCDEIISAFRAVAGKYIQDANVYRILPSYEAVDDVLCKYKDLSELFA